MLRPAGYVWKGSSGPPGLRQRIEEARYLVSRALGILVVRKVTGIREGREIQVGKELTQTVGPRYGKRWIVFGPPHRRRQLDRRRRLHMLCVVTSPLVDHGSVVGKAALEVARLFHVGDEG